MRLFRLLTLALTGTVAACDASPATTPLGSMDLTVTTPSTKLTTADGWSIDVAKFLVNVSAVTVAGTDGFVAASATPQLVDQAAPGTKALLTASVRTARNWDAVSFEVGPAATGTITELPPVTAADHELMSTNGYSVYLEAKATKAGVTKSLKWGFTSDTVFKDCAGELNGAVVRGLLVPPDGNDTADVRFDPAVFFKDDPDPTKGALRFDAIASADANDDGAITMDELHAVTLESAVATGGAYPAGTPPVADLGAYIDTQTRAIVTSFRAKGACTAEVLAAAQ